MYAISHTVSPALVAQYQTRLPDKVLLQTKLDEFYELAKSEAEQPAREAPKPSQKATKKRKGKKP